VNGRDLYHVELLRGTRCTKTMAMARSKTSRKRRQSPVLVMASVRVGDYDNDGFPDLYVTQYGRNVLYRNNGNGTFTDVTDKAGVAALEFGAHFIQALRSSITTAMADWTLRRQLCRRRFGYSSLLHRQWREDELPPTAYKGIQRFSITTMATELSQT